MDQELMKRLLEGKRKRKPSYANGFAFVRTATGELEKVAMTSEVRKSIGRYEGKQGTVKRSRKGRSSIKPNGTRFYNAVTELEVVSYVIR